MKIAINCAFFQPRGGGIKEYIYNLVSNLLLIDGENDYILYVLKDQLHFAQEAFPKARLKVMPYSSNQVIRRSLFENIFWRKEEETEKFDIFHSPFFHAPRFKNTKIILTVHDLRFCVYPSTYTFKRLVFLRHAVRHSLTRANHIISISEFTKKELMRFYNLPSEKITTIHEAINRDKFSVENIERSKCDNEVIDLLTNKTFLFTLGHVEPRKNYISLVKAFKLLQMEYPNIYLVIAGKKAQGYDEFSKIIKDIDNVLYLDYVSRETLLWLYKNAIAFVFPSIYEGFGFPPLEAAALGTPSVVANSSCIPEICGESALYFDPYNVCDMKNACKKILTNPELRNELRQRSIINLLRFSWKQNAISTFNLYKYVYEQEKV